MGQPRDMPVPFSPWRPLAISEVARLPQAPGVFEIGTLVRTVLFIGAAHESLLAVLTHHLGAPGHPLMHASRLYFRIHPTEEPEQLQTRLLGEYKNTHGGALPPAQDTPAPPPGTRRHLKAV